MCSIFHKDNVCDCVNKESGPCSLYSSSYLLKKLCSLFGDDFAQKMIHRHCRLINDYINISASGILLKDIPYLLLALEFLATHVKRVPEYAGLLQALLDLCCLPPLMKHPSEGHYHIQDLEEFFNLLGYLIVLIRNDKLQRSCLRAIHCQLTHQEPVNLASVKLKLCLSAMEQSRLATTVAQLLEVAPAKLYLALLNLALFMTTISIKCSQKMVTAGGLNAVLLRLDPHYPQYPQCPQQDQVLGVSDVSYSLLWALMRALQVSDGGTSPQWPAPSLSALRSLRNSLRYSVWHRKSHARNVLAGLSLLALEVFPNLLIVESGLAQDLVKLSVLGEPILADSWLAEVPISSNPLDFELKRLLMLTSSYLMKHPAAVEFLVQYHVIPSLLHLLDPCVSQTNSLWTNSQRWALLISALQTLSVLVQHLPAEIVSQGGTVRLLLLLEWYMQQPYDQTVLYHTLATLFHLAATQEPSHLHDICSNGGISIVCRLCNCLLNQTTISSTGQRVLTLGFLLLVSLCQNQKEYQKQHDETLMQLTLRLLNKVVDGRSDDPPIDDRLVIAAADLLWEGVVWCPEICKSFIKAGGVYKLLDVLQQSIFPVQVILLGILVDLCDHGACIPHLATWRATDTGKGYLPLLVSIWREEERQLHVRRGTQGTIEDIELPLMGEEQWYHTFYCKKDPSTSPAIVNIYGSVRPKTYAIVQLINHRHKDRMKECQEFYQMFHNVLDTKDQVTLQVMQNYLALKMGEVWEEVSYDIKHLGIQPLVMDGSLVGALTLRQRIWATQVQALQFAVLRDGKMQELGKESNLYRLVRECGLTHKLRALQELELVASTTDHRFFDRQKQHERSQVTVIFPEDVPLEQQHRTYDPKPTFKMVAHQSIKIQSGKDEIEKSQTSPLNLKHLKNWDWFHLDHSNCKPSSSHCTHSD